MSADFLPIHAGLVQASRWPWRRAESSAAVDSLALLGIGFGAAILTAAFDFGLKLPGHAILRAVLPMACGLALIPRHRAGLMMGAGALSGVGFVSISGRFDLGLGAATSLLLMGPVMDFALMTARPGRSVYLRMAIAGALANGAAFAVKFLEKSGVVTGGRQPLATWLPRASITYIVCGLAAGLISALLVFRMRPNSDPPTHNAETAGSDAGRP